MPRLLLAALILLQAACSGLPRSAEESRKSLGTVGVLVSPSPPLRGDGLPVPVTGAWSGFKRGAGIGFNSAGGQVWAAGPIPADSGSGEAALVYCGILALPLAAGITGGMVGSFMSLFRSVPADQVESAKASILKALSESDPASALSRELKGVVVLKEGGEASVDSVLLVSVTHAGLSGGSGMNPDLNVLMTLDYRLLSGRPPRLLSKGSLGYENTKVRRKFVDWGKDDAKLLREELALAYPSLAESLLKTALSPP